MVENKCEMVELTIDEMQSIEGGLGPVAIGIIVGVIVAAGILDII